MGQQAKDAGESEGVRCNGVDTGPAFARRKNEQTSSRCLVTRKPEKQLSYGKADDGRSYHAGAPMNGNVWLPPVGIVKSAHVCAGGSPCQGALLRCLSGMR